MKRWTGQRCHWQHQAMGLGPAEIPGVLFKPMLNREVIQRRSPCDLDSGLLLVLGCYHFAAGPKKDIHKPPDSSAVFFSQPSQKPLHWPAVRIVGPCKGSSNLHCCLGWLVLRTGWAGFLCSGMRILQEEFGICM